MKQCKWVNRVTWTSWGGELRESALCEYPVPSSMDVGRGPLNCPDYDNHLNDCKCYEPEEAE
jgi:hypothetical protein